MEKSLVEEKAENTAQGAAKISEMLTIEEIATALKVSTRTVNDLLMEGEIRGFKVGQQWRVRPEVFEEWVAAGGSPAKPRNGSPVRLSQRQKIAARREKVEVHS